MSIGSSAMRMRQGADPNGFYRGRTVLVTGGGGMIGSNLVSALIRAGTRQVIVFDDFSAARLWNVPRLPGVVTIRGSVNDDVALDRVFASRPSLVFHLAAFFANQRSVEHPEIDLRVNGFGTLAVFQRAAQGGVERVVYASTGCGVYGPSPPAAVTEDSVSLQPTTPYQATKLLGELYANYFAHHYQLNVVKLRFFNVYGPGELPGRYRNVVPNFMYHALLGRALSITGTGQETRDFTYVGDAVQALLAAGSHRAARGAALNIASGTETRIADLATKINELTSNESGVSYAPQRRWDTKTRLSASIEAARRTLDYRRRHPLTKG